MARGRSTTAGAVIGALAGLLMVSGCAAGEVGADAAAPMPMTQGAPAEAAVSSPGEKRTQLDPQVITTAWLTIRVESVATGVDALAAEVQRARGSIQQQDITTTDGTQTATVVARVPAAGLDDFLADVQGLGTVENLSRQATDVTQQRIDLDARIGALTASITRLQELLEQADTVTDLVAVETELANRQAELDALTAQRDYLADQVAMSTVTMTLMPTVRAGGVQAPGFLAGLQNGVAALGASIGIAITALGFLLPFLLILAVIAIPVAWVIVRRARRPH